MKKVYISLLFIVFSFICNPSFSQTGGAEAIKAKREAQKKAEEAQRKEEARKKAEEDTKKKAEEDAQRKIEETKRKAEEESQRKVDEAKRKAEEESQRKIDEAKRKVEEDTKRKTEEETKKKIEDAKRKAEEDARIKIENEKRKAEEAKRSLESARQRNEINNTSTNISTIRGTVMDKKTREPLIGATVYYLYNGQKKYLMADKNGRFFLNRPYKSEFILYASYLGYKMDQVTVRSDQNDVTIPLIENKKLGPFAKVGITAAGGIDYFSFKRNSEILVEPTAYMPIWNAGIDLRLFRSTFNILTGISYGNGGFNELNDDNKIVQQLKYQNISAPLKLRLSFGGFSLYAGAIANYNFGTTYKNNLLDCKFKEDESNLIINPWTFDGTVGINLGAKHSMFSLNYVRSLTNQINTNYNHTINSYSFQPFKDVNYTKNIFTISFTYFL